MQNLLIILILALPLAGSSHTPSLLGNQLFLVNSFLSSSKAQSNLAGDRLVMTRSKPQDGQVRKAPTLGLTLKGTTLPQDTHLAEILLGLFFLCASIAFSTHYKRFPVFPGKQMTQPPLEKWSNEKVVHATHLVPFCNPARGCNLQDTGAASKIAWVLSISF